MSKNFEATVKALEEMAKDKAALSDIGSRLVKQVARAVAEEKRGTMIENPDLEVAIRKGEVVPAQLSDRIKVDAAGRALEDVTAQIQNLAIWLRVWVRIWVRFGGIIFRDSPLNQFEDFADRIRFDDVESKLLTRLGKIAG